MSRLLQSLSLVLGLIFVGSGAMPAQAHAQAEGPDPDQCWECMENWKCTWNEVEGTQCWLDEVKCLDTWGAGGYQNCNMDMLGTWCDTDDYLPCEGALAVVLLTSFRLNSFASLPEAADLLGATSALRSLCKGTDRQPARVTGTLATVFEPGG
jgi:hypothetical protein